MIKMPPDLQHPEKCGVKIRSDEEEQTICGGTHVKIHFTDQD
jgi:hypothetical protein